MTTGCVNGGRRGARRWASRSIRSRENSTTPNTAQRTELIGGQTFTRPERTPLLRAAIDRADAIVRAEVNVVALDIVVARDPDLLLSTHAVLIPDLAVFRGPTWTLPDLVIEYRAESTDRLFFGPKRLAYARARVPELWFVHVSNATVTVLRLGDGIDYPWPAHPYAIDDTIGSSSLAGLSIPVTQLL